MEKGARRDRHRDTHEATERTEMLSDTEKDSRNEKTMSGRNPASTGENISTVVSTGGRMHKEVKGHEGLSADSSMEAENDKREMLVCDSDNGENTAADAAGGDVYPICLFQNVHAAGQQNVNAVSTQNVQSVSVSGHLNPLARAAIGTVNSSVNSSVNRTAGCKREGVNQIQAENFTKCVEDHNSDEPLDASNPPLRVVNIAMGTVQKPYYCLVCHQAFTTSSELVAHAKTHSAEQEYQCPNCMSSFSRKADLKKHSKLCTDGSDSELSISFEKASGQKKKKKNNITREKSKSSDGSVSSAEKADSTTAKTQPKRFTCSECPLAFPNMARLRKHMRTHTGEKPFACSLCPSAFGRSSDLTRHHRTHSGDRPYQCTMCPAAFPTSCKLTMHTRTHTGEKPYRCAHCPGAFARKTDLNMHERTHTGVKPHLCSQCTMSFTTASKLKVHSRVHSGEKPYQCPLCFARFTQTAGLRKHSKLHIKSSHGSDTS